MDYAVVQSILFNTRWSKVESRNHKWIISVSLKILQCYIVFKRNWPERSSLTFGEHNVISLPLEWSIDVIILTFHIK